MMKLLIFDLDGTLADTSRDITDALNYALGPLGVRKYSVEETKAMVGSGISTLLGSLVPSSNNNPDAKDEVLGRFLNFYSGHLMDNTVAYPHVRETLAQLTGYKKVVLSNKRTGYSKEILEHLFISEYFDAVCGSDSVREKKPSPIPVLDLMKKYNVSKEDTVIIGDSNFDIEAGRAAGIKVIAASYGFRARKFLDGADYIIDRFDELTKIIPGI